MSAVHFILQGKGGVGKSFVASLLVQYLRTKEKPVTAVDTDPVNATLAGYRAFDTYRLDLLENGAIVERNFDKLIEKIIEEDGEFVIDNGASSFIPLAYYMNENAAFDILADNGKEVYIHTVVTGGQAMMDTIDGFSALVKQTPENAKLVVWINEYFGEVIHPQDGRKFEELKPYIENRKRVAGIVPIRRKTASTYGDDVRHMLEKKITFDEVPMDQDFALMAKSRLSAVKKEIFRDISVVL